MTGPRTAPERHPGRPRPGALLRDGALAAVTQPVATATAAVVVALVCLVVLLTTGRTAATEREVVASIDSVGTRLVTVTDTTGHAAIPPSAVADVQRLAGVTWAFGLGPASDTRNADVPAGRGVAIRPYVGELPPELRVELGRAPAAPDEVLVGVGARSVLGLGDPAGALVDGDRRVGVVGVCDGGGPLSFVDDLALRRPADDESFPVRGIYVLVDDAAHATSVAAAVAAVVPTSRPDALEVRTSDGVLALREVVAGRLGAASRQLMAGVLAGGLVLVTVTMLGAVASRRRDFGRRRALGASRSAVVVLVLVQSAVAGLAGSVVGTVGGVVALAAGGTEVPPASFVAGVGLLALLVTLAGSVPPAVAAATRDPVRILRVP